MNLLFISDNPPSPLLGGIERVTDVLASALSSRGHKICCVYDSSCQRSMNGPTPTYMTLYPVDFDAEDGVFKITDIINEQHIDAIINQKETLRVLKIVKQLRKHTAVCSVLHNMPFPTYGRERQYKILTRPTTIKGKLIRLATILYPRIYRIANLRHNFQKYKEMLDSSDKLLLLSERFISRMTTYMGEETADKISFINNPNSFQSSAPDLSKKEKLIIWVGRIEDPQKNIGAFLNVWKDFSLIHPDWKAIIVGDGSHRNHFEKKAKKMNLSNLSFAGSQKDVDKFYTRATFLCLTSMYEGWGMVLPEAMAHGCIPAAFNSYDAVFDIIEDNKSGLIINQDMPQEMSHRLDEICEDSELLKDMAACAQKSIERFSSDRIAAHWEDILEEVIATKNKSHMSQLTHI